MLFYILVILTIVLLLVLIRFVLIYGRNFTDQEFVGVYVSNFKPQDISKHNLTFLANTPEEVDTLELRSNKTFSSKFFGTGTYELIRRKANVKPHMIVLSYNIDGKNLKFAFDNHRASDLFNPKPVLEFNRDSGLFYNKTDK